MRASTEQGEQAGDWFQEVLRWSHLLAQQRAEEELFELMLRVAAERSGAHEVSLFVRDHPRCFCGRVFPVQREWAFEAQDPSPQALRAAERFFEQGEGADGLVPLEHEGDALGALVFQGGAPSPAVTLLLPHMSVALVNNQLYSSLEQLVEHEMMTVVQREESIRLILDSMQEGLLVISLGGEVTETRSRAIEAWFGQVEEGAAASAYLFPDDPTAQEMFHMGLEEIVDDFMPFEVLVQQLPSRVERDGHSYQLGFERVLDGGELSQLLIVVRDVTSELEAERAERELHELTAVVQVLSQQPDEFVRFMDDMHHQVQRLETESEPGALARVVHTLKGNAALMGLRAFSQACHGFEDEVAAGEKSWQMAAAVLRPGWDQAVERISGLLPQEEDERHYLYASEVEELRRLSAHHHRELSELVRRLEWEPFELVVSRCSREVRRVAKRQGKLCDIQVVGGELRLPPKVSSFAMSLVHIARNAIDHGIEPPEEREDKGKDRAGTLTWSLEERAYHSILSVSDDGAGIRWERVRQVAQERGLPCDTPQELTDALLADGFSTAREVTAISGRGMGMAAVLSELRGLGGNLELHSRRGEGTRWAFIIPKWS